MKFRFISYLTELYRRVCQQAPGYVLPPVDECTLNPGQCGEGGRCVDTDTGYTCECYPGFRLNSVTDRCQGQYCNCHI